MFSSAFGRPGPALRAGAAAWWLFVETCATGRLVSDDSEGTPSKKRVSHLRLFAELHPAVNRSPEITQITTGTNNRLSSLNEASSLTTVKRVERLSANVQCF